MPRRKGSGLGQGVAVGSTESAVAADDAMAADTKTADEQKPAEPPLSKEDEAKRKRIVFSKKRAVWHMWRTSLKQ